MFPAAAAAYAFHLLPQVWGVDRFGRTGALEREKWHRMSRNHNRRGGIKRSRSNSEWATDKRDVTTLSNAAFEAYYKDNVIPAEEWESFMEALRRALPTAIRVHPSVPCATAVSEYVRSRLLHAALPVQPIPFIPDNMAFQSSISRGDLKRTTELKEVKRLISALNEGGFLTRQETVSMIPVVLLQVAPGNRVLDMCAAPGSKTSQILEAVISSNQDGVVVANDLNVARLDVLLHQTARSPGAHPHLIVTNYDGTQFPLLPKEDKFDRVLCDVMCSGDGTLRKSMDMWPRWNTVHGADLHVTQVRVLTRGMMLCKKGGIVVYSTCSLNPVEDEAVVSECLSQAKGTFRLIDPAPFLKDFVTVPGQTDWFLLTKDLTQKLRTFEDAEAYNQSKQAHGFRYRKSMFSNAQVLREQNIHFARRVVPHQQDTGGFFFAAMECVEDYPLEDADVCTAATKQPFSLCSPALQEQVRGSLGLPGSFPACQLYVRNEVAREQKFYFASKATCKFFPKLGARIVHVGCKMFESYAKYSNDKLRFSTEGAASLVPLLPSEFIIEADAAFVLRLGANGTVPASELPSPPPPYSNFLLSCKTSLVETIYVAMERKVSGQFGAKVAEWQLSILKLTLGLPFVECTADGTAADECCVEES